MPVEQGRGPGAHTGRIQMSAKPLAMQAGCQEPNDPGTLSVEAARQRIIDNLEPLGATQTLALRDALGYTLGEDLISPVDVPAHTNSAVDGYALRGADLPSHGERAFDCIASAFAGHPSDTPVGAGQCIRIMTGAPLPAGADTVVMQEQTRVEDDRVWVGAGHRVGQNVRHAGEDLARGRPALHAGTALLPAHLGLVASLGMGEVRVQRPPRVAFFSTGDELRSIGEPLGAGEIYDSNRYTLYGMLRRLGVSVLDLGVVRDRPQALRDAFQRAAEDADVLITSGGVSVGESDFVKDILDELGTVNFWKIAMKPGRPFAFGRLGDCAFFGLPGNPVAVMVTFYQFVRPALLHLAGRTPAPLTPVFKVRCDSEIRKKPGRTEFYRGILEPGEDGALTVRSAGAQGSGVLRSMAEANCFVILPPESGSVSPGTLVDVQPFEGLV